MAQRIFIGIGGKISMKIVLAIDSYKGCASSAELSLWAKEAILAVDEKIHVVPCVIADGGEGLLDAMLSIVAGDILTCKVHGPLMEEVEAQYAILEDRTTAVIEMAQASGLPLVPAEKRNPLKTTTYGVGELMKDALLRGCRTFIVGIGGSATNDAGVGMMQALGYRFLDDQGCELAQGGQILEAVAAIDDTHAMQELQGCEVIVACDVDNVMTGKLGCAHVYAAQKGADAAMIERLDAGMVHFAECLKALRAQDVAMNPGSGAAGGMGGGLQAFLGAELKPGIEILLDAMKFDALLEDATLVISGEGRIDRQSLMGKVLSGVSKRCQKANVPVIALGGGVSDDLETHEGIDALFSIMRYPMLLEEAMEKPRAKKLLKQSVQEIVRLIKAIQRKR
jgi:glycerate kinase